MFSLLAQLRCNQNDMLDYRSIAAPLSKVIVCKFPSSWRQIFEKLQREIEISYDCVVTEGHRTRTKNSVKSPMESFPSIELQSVAG